MMAQPVQQQQAAPNIIISNNQQVAGGGGDKHADDAAALMVFVIGWFCPLVWLLGSCCYIRSPSPTARMWSWISLICGIIETALLVALIVYLVNATNSAINSIYSGSFSYCRYSSYYG